MKGALADLFTVPIPPGQSRFLIKTKKVSRNPDFERKTSRKVLNPLVYVLMTLFVRKGRKRVASDHMHSRESFPFPPRAINRTQSADRLGVECLVTHQTGGRG